MKRRSETHQVRCPKSGCEVVCVGGAGSLGAMEAKSKLFTHFCAAHGEILHLDEMPEPERVVVEVEAPKRQRERPTDFRSGQLCWM